MSAKEFYKKEYGFDLSKLSSNMRSIIGSDYLEDIIWPKEALLEEARKAGVDILIKKD